MWLWVKRYPNWNPGKWKHGLKPAVPWWLNFDPYPFTLYKRQGFTSESKPPSRGFRAKQHRTSKDLWSP